MGFRKLIIPSWVKHRQEQRRERERQGRYNSDPFMLGNDARSAPSLSDSQRASMVKSLAQLRPTRDPVRRMLKGICSERDANVLRKVAAARLRRHEDRDDPFTLPAYRHPHARRRAREARMAVGA